MWTTVSLRREVRDALEELMRELGLSSPNDAVAYLLRRYRECGKLEELLSGVLERLRAVEEGLVRLEKLLAEALPKSGAATVACRAVSPKGSEGSRGGSRAWEILVREGASCASEMKGVKDPGAVVEKLVREGAYAVSLESDRCAVLPEAVEELLGRLRSLRSSEPRVVEAQLESERLRKVFRVLYEAGALYYEKGEGWMLLEDALERPGAASGAGP